MASKTWHLGKPARLTRRFSLSCDTSGRWVIHGTRLHLERSVGGWTLAADDSDWAAFLFRNRLEDGLFGNRQAALRAVTAAAAVDERLLRRRI